MTIIEAKGLVINNDNRPVDLLNDNRRLDLWMIPGLNEERTNNDNRPSYFLNTRPK